MHKYYLYAALAGLTTAASTMTAHADDATLPKEKCYGIAKAGENSCKSTSSGHSCAGKAAKDYDPREFKLVNAGECTKNNGKLTPQEEM